MGIMKRLLLLSLFVCACTTTARAEWRDVKEGLNVQAVLAAIGTPMMVNKSKSGRQVTWTYDDGAYVLFENGRVRFFKAPPGRASRAKLEGKA
jgi:hypothetical protein